MASLGDIGKLVRGCMVKLGCLSVRDLDKVMGVRMNGFGKTKKPISYPVGLA